VRFKPVIFIKVLKGVLKNKMASKLFVGNIPFGMTDDQLTEAFAAYGTVISANIVVDKFSKRSKGFGFVEFENEEDAKKAMGELDGSEQQGRNINVKEAIPRSDEGSAPSAAPVEAAPVEEVEAPAEEAAPVEEKTEEVVLTDNAEEESKA
jgi:cold-inducible RNA-binding protein